jgi:hypothetical protein
LEAVQADAISQTPQGWPGVRLVVVERPVALQHHQHQRRLIQTEAQGMGTLVEMEEIHTLQEGEEQEP